MNAQHTPGEWVVKSWTEHDKDGAIESCGDQVVARLPNGGEVGIFTTALEGESIADLCLIAAAPGLLAACINARDMLATDRQAFVDCQRLRDTRTDDPIAHGLVWVKEDVWLHPDDAEPLRDYDRAIALIDSAIAKATAGAGGADAQEVRG